MFLNLFSPNKKFNLLRSDPAAYAELLIRRRKHFYRREKYSHLCLSFSLFSNIFSNLFFTSFTSLCDISFSHLLLFIFVLSFHFFSTYLLVSHFPLLSSLFTSSLFTSVFSPLSFTSHILHALVSYLSFYISFSVSHFTSQFSH
jgi:hypothetical protein